MSKNNIEYVLPLKPKTKCRSEILCKFNCRQRSLIVVRRVRWWALCQSTCASIGARKRMSASARWKPSRVEASVSGQATETATIRCVGHATTDGMRG